MMPRAIAYTRCSTHERADGGLALDAQGKRIGAYCHTKGLALLDIVTHASVSGGKLLAKREGGQVCQRAVNRVSAVRFRPG